MQNWKCYPNKSKCNLWIKLLHIHLILNPNPTNSLPWQISLLLRGSLLSLAPCLDGLGLFPAALLPITQHLPPLLTHLICSGSGAWGRYWVHLVARFPPYCWRCFGNFSSSPLPHPFPTRYLQSHPHHRRQPRRRSPPSFSPPPPPPPREGQRLDRGSSPGGSRSSMSGTRKSCRGRP